MSFAYNKNNSIKNIDSKQSISKNIFKETLTYIDKQWDEWNNNITKLNTDSNNLQRMYNEYNRDPKYLELRQQIINQIEIKKNHLLELEKIVINLKLQISSFKNN